MVAPAAAALAWYSDALAQYAFWGWVSINVRYRPSKLPPSPAQGGRQQCRGMGGRRADHAEAEQRCWQRPPGDAGSSAFGGTCR